MARFMGGRDKELSTPRRMKWWRRVVTIPWATFCASKIDHQFRFRRAAFYSQLKSKIDSILHNDTPDTDLPSTSRLLSTSLSLILYPILSLHLVCERLSPLTLTLSLTLYRNPSSYISPSSRFIGYNKTKNCGKRVPPLSCVSITNKKISECKHKVHVWPTSKTLSTKTGMVL